MAALEDWTISGLDVRNTYLYGELDEEIYMEQPEGFHVQGLENLVIRLKKALYGLKQAGLVWWQTLRDSMSGPLDPTALSVLATSQVPSSPTRNYR